MYAMNSFQRSILNAVWCLSWVALSMPLLAQAPPSGDTFVSSGTPKVNYGSSGTLVVAQGTNSYVQFNLSGVPMGTNISRATLRLYVDAVLKAGSLDVYQLNAGWNENTLTYSTPAPAPGVSATGGHPVAITATNCNQFLLIDITALTQGWVNGTIVNNGIALTLTAGSTGSFSFDSKESLLTANGPALEMVVSGGGTPGPQGAAGPQGPAGATGPKGDTGAVGPQGAQGIQGPQGEQGPQGPQGQQGGQGPQGLAGLSGTSGYANFSCPIGQSVVGFNGAAQPVCSNTTGGGGGGGGGTLDSDGDGIPDAIDPCPMAPNRTYNGVSYCPETIYDVNKGTITPGASVALTNVQVVYVSPTQVTFEIMPGDSAYNGADFSSITADLGTVPPPGLGNRVNVYGMTTVGAGLTVAALEVVSAVTSAPTLSFISPSNATVSVGGSVTLTINTTAPLTSDQAVEFTFLGPAASADPVVIPAGLSSATFTVTGIQAGAIIVRANMNGAQVTSHLQVLP